MFRHVIDKTRHVHHNEKGFTLYELLLGFVIMGSVGLVLVQLLSSTLSYTKDELHAYQFRQEQKELTTLLLPKLKQATSFTINASATCVEPSATECHLLHLRFHEQADVFVRVEDQVLTVNERVIGTVRPMQVGVPYFSFDTTKQMLSIQLLFTQTNKRDRPFTLRVYRP